MASLAKLSDDELEQESYRLQHEKDAIRDEQRAVRAEFDRRDAERRAAALLEGLSDAERDVLVKAVAAGATAS